MAQVTDIGTAEVGARLADAVEAALPGWVVRSVERLLLAFHGRADPALLGQAAEVGRRAASEVGAELRRLVSADVDRQWTNPLAIVRGAVRYPAEVLRAAGVPGVVRDEFDEAHFPDDDYGLTPMSFADVDPDLADVGFAWGAAKAMAHRARHRS